MFTQYPLRPNQSELFRGRRTDLDAILSHLKDGGNAIIHGVRGIGKSSFAYQIIGNFHSSHERESAGKHPSSICAWVNNEGPPKNLNAILSMAVTSNEAEFSLSEQAKSVYDRDEFSYEIRKRFDLSLRDQVKMSILAEIEEPDPILKQLFMHVVRKVKAELYADRIIFFVDEMDRSVNTSGVAEFLKDFSECQFVFIGIGDSARDVVKNHPSTFRNIAGGIREIRPMKNSEIRSIFTESTSSTQEGLRFDPQFLKKAGHYCGGIPWTAMLLGQFATRGRTDTRIGVGEFHQAWMQMEREWEDTIGFSVDYSVLGTKIYRQILETVMQNNRYFSAQEVASQIKKSVKSVESALMDLDTAKVLFKREDDFFRFSDPMVRGFCLKRLEDKKK